MMFASVNASNDPALRTPSPSPTPPEASPTPPSLNRQISRAAKISAKAPGLENTRALRVLLRKRRNFRRCRRLDYDVSKRAMGSKIVCNIIF